MRQQKIINENSTEHRTKKNEVEKIPKTFLRLFSLYRFITVQKGKKFFFVSFTFFVLKKSQF